MPWKATCIMDERIKMIAECLRGVMPKGAIFARHGISRKTGYKWLARYRAESAQGLVDRDRAPHRPGQGVDAAVAAAIVAERERHPHWGPKKLRARLARLAPDEVWPAPSTIGDLLRREGLSLPRRRRWRAEPAARPFLEVRAPNDVWCADFKGWFRTADGTRCDPLTISDAHSRLLITCRIVPPTHAGVFGWFERAFGEHGLPRALRTDNGPPFASSGAGGLTRLAVHWIKLGIKLERIAPGAPQQNGRHERMHRTLKAETTHPPAATLAAQQARFDRFRQLYNRERPHEALDQTVPAAHYTPSPRLYPSRLAEPVYDADHAVRRVRPSGEIKWGGETIFVSEALAGELVGLAEAQDGGWIVRFADLDLGLLVPGARSLRRFTAPRPGLWICGRRQSVAHIPTGPTAAAARPQ